MSAPTPHAPGSSAIVPSADAAALPTPVTLEPPGLAHLCDLVVTVRPGEIQTIGGNVSDVVAMSRVPVDAEGRLLPDPKRPWAAVVARRGPVPLSACALVPPTPTRGAAQAP
jgi:hypothetical protein